MLTVKIGVSTWDYFHSSYDMARLTAFFEMRQDWLLAADDVWATHGADAAYVFLLGA